MSSLLEVQGSQSNFWHAGHHFQVLVAQKFLQLQNSYVDWYILEFHFIAFRLIFVKLYFTRSSHILHVFKNSFAFVGFDRFFFSLINLVDFSSLEFGIISQIHMLPSVICTLIIEKYSCVELMINMFYFPAFSQDNFPSLWPKWMLWYWGTSYFRFWWCDLPFVPVYSLVVTYLNRNCMIF